MDVNFSNAALHWIQDHRKAFQNFWEMLKPMNDNNNNHEGINGNSNIGGSGNSTGSSQLLIYCGGMEIYSKSSRY
jgi:hypothetical protein